MAVKTKRQESPPSNADLIYWVLRDEIVTLKLPPGHRLSDKELSLRFDVSRTPVREALLRLVDEGMVMVRPNSGTHVARINPSALRNAQFLRRAVECTALAEIRFPLPVGAVDELHRLIAAQVAEATAVDVAAFFRLDEEFHRRLLSLSGNDDAWPVVDRAKAQLNRVRYLAILDRSRMERVVSQHTNVADALKAEDSALASQILRNHLVDSFKTIERTVKVYGNYFSEDSSKSQRKR